MLTQIACMRRSLCLYIALALPVVSISPRLCAQAPEGLVVSANQRYLETDSGEPFFWLGDTAWELFHRLDREEADAYLQQRAEQGFNVIQAVALAELDGLNTPNAYGDLPLHDLDPAQPNEAYFKHVDYIVRAANRRGLVVGMLPTWGDKFNKRWGIGPEVFTPKNAETFGRFMAQRYRDDSIVWILGGDRIPETDEHFAIIDAMAKGIRSGDGGRALMSYHPMGRQRSSRFFHDREWLDFNMHQSGHNDPLFFNFAVTLADYELSPPKPAIDAEPGYEDHPIDWKPELGWIDAFDSRRLGYWSVLSGAFGHTYGHHSIWQMWQEGRAPVSSARTPWQEALHYPGARQAGYMRAAFESIEWQTLEPAQDLLVTVIEDPAKSTRIAASPDRRLVVVYTPFGSAFQLRATTPPDRARWFDPRDGHSIPIEIPSAEDGIIHFDPPGDEQRGNDWLLILCADLG